MSPLDIIDQPIEVGSKVCFASREGNAGKMVLGTVTTIREQPTYPWRTSPFVVDIRTAGKRNTERSANEVMVYRV